MNNVVALASLIEGHQVWRGRAAHTPVSDQRTGWPTLDAVLPSGGWRGASLTEILLPADGVGELQLVLPTLARFTQTDRSRVAGGLASDSVGVAAGAGLLRRHGATAIQ